MKRKKMLAKYIFSKYTFMLVPHSNGKTIQVGVPAGFITAGCAAAGLLMASTVFFSLYTAQFQKIKQENIQLASIKEAQAEELLVLKEKAEQLGTVLLENEDLKVLNEEHMERIEELSYIAEDTMEQLEWLLNMENDLREQLGFEPIKSVGGPAGEGELTEQFSLIQSQVALQQEGISEINKQIDYLQSLPFRWPTVSKKITSVFGVRSNPFGGSTTENHGAIDIAGSYGDEIYAAGKGRVSFAGWQSGYGYTIVIDHGHDYSSRYSHCSSLAVKEGDEVTGGQLIAYMGSTGRSTGPHLDFRVRYGEDLIDPLSILNVEGLIYQ